MNDTFITSSKAGIAGGTLTVILAHINAEDILKTIVMAAIGAAVSFGVTTLMKFVIARFKK